MELTCNQVEALMPFYIENKLSQKLTKFIDEHLSKCPICQKKFKNIRNIAKNDINIDDTYQTKQYEDFKLNLSAYIDNELDDIENIKIKKIAISNPLARQDLENIYSFKKLLHNSYEKTKNDLKYDFSKKIINNLQEENNKNYNNEFYKLLVCFSAIITFLVTGIIYILYF